MKHMPSFILCCTLAHLSLCSTSDEENPNYYEILAIKNSASQQQIRKAYLAQAKLWHPDKHNDKNRAHIQMQKINSANEILSNPNKKKEYDEQLSYNSLVNQLTKILIIPLKLCDIFGCRK